jgi:signal transduction histidine kinase
MMKTIGFTLLLSLLWGLVFSQNPKLDSIMLALKNAPNDAVRYQCSDELYGIYEESDRDSALYYAEMGMRLAKGKGQNLVFSSGMSWKGYQLVQKGSYGDALQCLLQAINILEDAGNEEGSWLLYRYDKPETIRLSILARTNQMMGLLMVYTQNYDQALYYLHEAKRIALLNGEGRRVGTADMVIGRVYIKLNKLDSALIFANNAEQIGSQFGFSGMLANIYWYQGDIYFLKGDVKTAKEKYIDGIKAGMQYQNLSGLARNYFSMTKFYLAEHEKDSSLFYAQKSLETINSLQATAQSDIDLGTAYENLYLSYLQRDQPDSAFKYQGLALAAKDSFYQSRINSLAEFQKLSFGEQMRLQQLEKEKETYQNQLKLYALLIGLGILLLVAFLLYRNNRQKQKANIILQEQKDKVESTLSQLKSTQSQLIQSEKMASLGELTAGIAHEIQNPLNFVNNFSEVSEEMIIEAEGSRHEAGENSPVVTELLTDIKQNLAKINHHGKRADAIVKGMLQHSRSTTGNRELTDVNDLVDEYVKLSFHAFRGKDNAFDVKLQTDFDPAVGAIELAPQEIGRVLLNILNNAFYAVNDRKKNDPALSPEVIVQTKKNAKGIEISIKDNGGGIPENIVGKIFQPFFTTKPTGQGTGLGLSLAYDIVKAHDGEIKVKSEKGIGSEFIIMLNMDS